MLIIDPSSPCRFVLVDRAVPVTDYTTKAPVVGEDGKPVFRYAVLAIRDEGRPVQITVKAPGVAVALEPGTPVSLQALSGVLWERDGKQAVSFSADGIAALGGKQ